MNTNHTNGDVRIGFYICHCGHNIAGMVDCAAVAQYIAKLPGVVVSRDYKYMCSDPGQELIQQDIREHKLNRVVVASCSPLLHEHTFRNAVAAGGLNPSIFQMVNIREHDSWVHTDRAEATAKAKSLARAAVCRVRFHRALETTRVPIHPDVLVVGGGIAGIHAALTVANVGQESLPGRARPEHRRAHGAVRQDVPHAGLRRLHPHPQDVRRPSRTTNITLWTYSEIVKVEGYVGNYKVTVKRKPRYVNEELCVGCLECINACVFKEAKFPDEFNVGPEQAQAHLHPLPASGAAGGGDRSRDAASRSGPASARRHASKPAPTARPSTSTQKEELVEIKVGNIIVATGFKTFDAKRIPAIRLRPVSQRRTPRSKWNGWSTASGPTSGEIVLRDGRQPKSVGIIHCVGSRDRKPTAGARASAACTR